MKRFTKAQGQTRPQAHTCKICISLYALQRPNLSFHTLFQNCLNFQAKLPHMNWIATQLKIRNIFVRNAQFSRCEHENSDLQEAYVI